MKKIVGYLSIATIMVASLMSFTSSNYSSYADEGDEFTFPTEIKSILDQSCYECHNTESSNMKGRLKLKLDQFSTMKKSKLVSKLNKIAKKVEKGAMPTKKFVANHPDKVPTDAQKKVLIDWARKTASELMGE